MSDRLDAFLSHRGFGTRSHVRVVIRQGRVTLDGVVCLDQATQVRGAVIRVDGKALERGVQEATLLLHKPVGYACSTDPAEAPLLGDLIPAAYQHLAMNPAGRLDRETSGLLIVTSDGGLIHALTNPRRHIPKRYRVLYRGTLQARAVQRCLKGFLLEGEREPTLPAQLELGEATRPGGGQATIILHEGRYHQVRRMFAALGGTVLGLHRDRIGQLDLPADLPPGSAREITPGERALLGSDRAEEHVQPAPSVLDQSGQPAEVQEDA